MKEADAVSGEPVPEWVQEAGNFCLEDLNALSKQMFGAAELYRKTGGMHIAALAAKPASAEGYFVAREDVGRHNAVDKVLGRGFLDGVEFRRATLLTSGRIAADMVIKAGVAGIPLIASRSIPTTEAYRLALERHIVLVGRMGSAEPIVYSGGSR
jgi:FdhD protein